MKIGLRTYLFLLLFAIKTNVFSQFLGIENPYFKAAKQAGVEGDFRKSADLCLQGLKKSPSDNDLRQQLGKSYMQLRELDSARYFLTKVVNEDEDNIPARQYLVNVEYQSKRYSSAICYVNELLEKKPYTKDLWLKKISIYKEIGNYGEIKRAIKRLRDIFPSDTVVEKQYNFIMSQEGLKVAKNGNTEEAKKIYLNILEEFPEDKNIYISLINLETNQGSLNSALEYAERGLIYYPNDLELIKKKIGVLEALKKYDVAISYLKSKNKDVPKDFFNKTERYLVFEAARFYENTDPYILHQKSYSLDRNRNSFQYLLNKSMERGYYNESLKLIDQGLLRYPNDKDLLVKQMFIYKKQTNISKYYDSVYTLYEMYPEDYDIRQEYASVLLSEAKEYTSQKQYQAALDNYFILLEFSEFSEIANNNIFVVYTLQNNTTGALSQIDAMIENEPEKKINLVKKAELLKDIKDFDAALNIVKNLILEFPEEKKYKTQYVYYSDLYMKDLISDELYYKTLPVADKSLEIDKTNKLTYNYAINASSAMKRYDKMLIYTDSAIYHYPNDIDLKLKRISAYSNLKNHQKATELLEELENKYPQDIRVKGVLVEERYKLATDAEKNEDYDLANTLYNSILLLDSLNIPTYQRLVNLSINQKDYANAMIYADKALEIEPNPEEKFFLYKKGVVYEMTEDYQNAYEYQKKKEDEDLNDHLDYLLNKKLKNILGLNYLKVYSGQESFTSAVARIYYQRILKKDTYGLRLNYASKESDGVGLQLQGEWSHKFSSTFYTQIDGYVGNRYFPKFKISGTAYKYLKNDWEIGLGVGLTKVSTGKEFFNVQGILSKDIGDFWLNARLNVLFSEGSVYNNWFGQARYNINDNGDYFVAMASTGNAPQEDRATNFQINTFLTYTNSMVGAGYRWNHKHKYTYGIQGNWYNFYIPGATNNGLPVPSSRVDQYHLLFVIQTKF